MWSHRLWVVLLGIVGLNSGASLAREVAVKNFRQIIQSYYSLTGLSQTDPELRELTGRLSTRLPQQGKVEDISSPLVLALTELSSVFCSKMIDQDAALPAAQRRLVHQTVDFTAAPRSMSVQTQEAVVRGYTPLFMQRDPTDAEVRILTTALQSAIANGRNDLTGTRKVLKTICVAVGSSLDFVVY